MTGKKIGLLGGTFNPIHNGHLLLAETARVQFALDSVLFIPNRVPPHRSQDENAGLASDEERHAMCILATLSNPFFEVSRIELDREGVSFTFDTVDALKKGNPDDRYYFICGADSIIRHSWHRFGELMDLLDGLLLAGRDPEGKEEARGKLKKEIPELLGKVRDVRMPAMEISATRVRHLLQEGGSIRYLVPEIVEEYIRKRKIYGRRNSHEIS